MNTVQKRKVLVEMQNLERDIAELKRCRMEIASSGYASATMSSGGGSKSYTRLDLSGITETIARMTKELQDYRTMLASDGERFKVKSILHIYG